MQLEAKDLSPQSAPIEWSALWDVMRLFESHGTWVPTTRAMYHEMLNCLPPAASGPGCFLVGEPSHTSGIDGDTMYACFLFHQGNYYARYMTISYFNSLFH